MWKPCWWCTYFSLTEADALAVLAEVVTALAAWREVALILHHLLRDRGDEIDEERIVKSATGTSR